MRALARGGTMRIGFRSTVSETGPIMPSTAIRRLTYRNESGVLEVEFTSGTVYEYFDVPEQVYRDFASSSSRGRYFAYQFRDKFPYRRKTLEEPAASHLTAAGILLFRKRSAGVEVFLVHPGGPFWRAKDDGAWSIPKGLYDRGEDPLAAAQREFSEETGFTAHGPFLRLGPFKVQAGKSVTIWAAEGDCDPADLVSNTFPLEWPPKSGKFQDTPEVDRGGWFGADEALKKVVVGQRQIITAFYDRVIPRRGAPAHLPLAARGAQKPAKERTSKRS